jgi:hypothetical protein
MRPVLVAVNIGMVLIALGAGFPNHRGAAGREGQHSFGGYPRVAAAEEEPFLVVWSHRHEASDAVFARA